MLENYQIEILENTLRNVIGFEPRDGFAEFVKTNEDAEFIFEIFGYEAGETLDTAECDMLCDVIAKDAGYECWPLIGHRRDKDWMIKFYQAILNKGYVDST